ncbi:MAG: UvrB/UvrC motif-containing protein [Planctomycetota bacterium]|nr:UvrB/UvrC motif-containing protein [Planctomycetota bacterium]
MKCESCHNKTARVHLTEIGSKMKREIHLCDECAREHEASLPHTVGPSSHHPAPGTPDLDLAGSGAEEETAAVCAVCGMTFPDFRSTGRFGCPEDYQVFRKSLAPILERIHSSTQHQGKVPPQAGEPTRRQRELRKLSDQLERAVKSENYEKAASLRDQLHDIREKSGAD